MLIGWVTVELEKGRVGGRFIGWEMVKQESQVEERLSVGWVIVESARGNFVG